MSNVDYKCNMYTDASADPVSSHSTSASLTHINNKQPLPRVTFSKMLITTPAFTPREIIGKSILGIARRLSLQRDSGSAVSSVSETGETASTVRDDNNMTCPTNPDTLYRAPELACTRSQLSFHSSVWTRTGTPTNIEDVPVGMVCSFCQDPILTMTTCHLGILNVVVSIGVCCLGGCLGCCFIPLFMTDLKNVKHFCPKCGNQLGEFKRL